MSLRHFLVCFSIISILQVIVIAQQDANSTKTEEEVARNAKGKFYCLKTFLLFLLLVVPLIDAHRQVKNGEGVPGIFQK